MSFRITLQQLYNSIIQHFKNPTDILLSFCDSNFEQTKELCGTL